MGRVVKITKFVQLFNKVLLATSSLFRKRRRKTFRVNNILSNITYKQAIPVTAVLGLVLGIFAFIKYDPFGTIDIYPKDDQAMTAGTVTIPAASNGASFVLALKEEQLSFNPDFSIVDTAFAEDTNAGPTATTKSEGTSITAEIKNSKGELAENIQVSISADTNNPEISVKKLTENQFKPGEYQLYVTLNKNGKEKVITQHFAWGVLAINTLKSIYTTGETAQFAFGVLDETGNTLCDAELNLEIETPTGEKSTLSTSNTTIKRSAECTGNTKIEEPDYSAEQIVSTPGTYKLKLTALTNNGSYFVDDELLVQENVPFDVERTNYPTRIYPAESYDVVLTVKANQDFVGKIEEVVPASFEISKTNGAAVLPTQISKIISWDVDIKKGQAVQLKYTVVFPNISPEFYLVGPLSFMDTSNGESPFRESRQWQIASDAVVVSGGITSAEAQFGGLQRKVAYVNSNWYAFYNDGTDVWYKKSSDGITWDTAVDVDATDADNYNPAISVSGTIIDVFWIDDSSERIEGKRIDTASADAQGTLCTGPSEGTIGSTFIPAVAAISATDAVIGFTDSSSDGEFNFYEVTGLNGTCTATDVQPGNIVLGTSITAGDKPVLVPVSSTKVGLVFQDGNLSYGEYDTVENEWKTVDLNIASNTDNTYSVVTDGAATPKTWILTQDALNTTDTNFYTLNAANFDFAETEVDADVGAANQDGLQDIDMFCVTADDCKLAYIDNMDTTTPDIVFRDCNNASCSSSTLQTLDTDCGTTNSVCNPKIHCSSATDCHLVYMEVATAPDIFFVDCDGANNTNACSTSAIVNTNTDFGGSTSTTHLDIDCPTGDNCKFIYGDDNNGTIMFVDCADDQCAIATDTLTNITTINYGTSVAGPKLALDCVSSTTCKIVAHDIDSGNVLLVDCSTAGTPETCATPPAAVTIEGSVGTTVNLVSVDIDCVADHTDCKILYTNDTNDDMRFADCNDTDCDAPTETTIDANGGASSTGEPDVDLYCVSATDCKFLYTGALTNDAEKLYFYDCDNAACTTGGVIEMPGPRFRGAVNCVGGTTDCKMVYYQGTTAAAPTVQFNDCDTGNCYPAVTDDADPWSSATNVLGVSLTYDSGNSDLLASILKDTSETAYYKTSDATTVSWGSETAYDDFSAAGDMDNISTPHTAADTSQAGALLRQGTNMEFDLQDALVVDPTLSQNHFRFRDDSTALNTDGGWVASLDTNYNTLERGDTYRLRFEIAETGTGPATNYDYNFEYAVKSTTCAEASYTSVPDTATSEPFEMALSGQYADGAVISSSRLTATGSFVNGFAVEEPSNLSSTHTLSTSQYSEFEYAFTPTTNAVSGTNYCFRLTNSGSTTNFTYSIYPEASIFEKDIRVHWAFNEGSGTIANNSVSGNFPGTITSATWAPPEQCLFDKCLAFNGTSSKVTTTSNITGVKSVSFWAKPSSTTTTFLQVTNSAYISASGGTLSATGFTNPTFYVNGQPSKTITANQWNHIVVTTSSGITTSTFTVGNNSTNYFLGFMDEVKVYKSTLSASDVKGLYAGKAATDAVSARFGSPALDTLTTSLVAHWPMNESAANSCTGGTNDTCDSTANGLNGAWGGTTTVTTAGKYGNAVIFDGSADRLEVADNALLDTDSTESMTLSVWVKRTGNSSFNNPMIIVDKQNVNAEAGYRLQLGTDGCFLAGTNDDLLCFQIWDGVDEFRMESTGTTITADSVWHHVVVIFDRADSTNSGIYIDGVSQGVTTTGTIASIGDASNTTALCLGANISGTVCDTGTLYNWNGSLDEVRMYNRAITTNEVQSLYTYAPGPVGHWTFDENTGTSSGDKSSNSSTGTLTGGATWLPGKYGSAASFDGTDDFVAVTDSSSLDSTRGAFTLEAWVYDTDVDDAVNDARIIIGKGDAASSQANSYRLRIHDGKELRLQIGDGTTSQNIVTSTKVIPYATWTHVAATFDGTNAKVYLNGVLAGGPTASTIGVLVDSGQFNIGRQSSLDCSTGFNCFQGGIDDVKIYNYARTQAQIAEDINAGQTLDRSLLAYWKLDETTGLTAYDTSGNGYNSTLSLARWTTAGKFGAAFDGNGAQRVALADNDAFDFAGADNFSISAWFKSDSGTDPSTDEYVISEAGGASGYAIYFDTDGDLLFGIDTDGTWTPTEAIGNLGTATDYYDNQWHHVVAVKTGTSRIDLYVDGVLKDSDVSLAANGAFTNATSLVFGSQDTVDDTDDFAGDIDEVKIYTAALTADQVKTEYLHNTSATLGSTSTTSNGITADNSKSREYCVPGDTTTCNGPVAEWKFDENTGSTIADSSGNGLNATVATTPPTWQPGKYGSAMFFSGVHVANDESTGNGIPFVTDTTGSVLDVTTSMSFEAWIYPTSVASYAEIIGKIPAAYGSGYEFANSTGTLRTTLRTAGGNCDYTAGTLTNNVWQHVMSTYDGTNTRHYINGVLQGTSTNCTFGSQANDNTLQIGNRASDGHFTGRIDQVRVWNYPRTQAQVAWSYNHGNPIAQYKLDDCTGSTAYNSAATGNGDAAGNNGTITIGGSGTNTSTGACSSGVSTAAWNNGTTGKRGASLSFDGTDDYIAITDPGAGSILDFNTGNQITLSAWFNPDILPTAGNFQTILTKGDTDGTGDDLNYGLFWGRESGSNELSFNFCYTNTSGSYHCFAADGNLPITVGQWHHISATYTFATGSSIKLYFNGQLVPGSWAGATGNDAPNVTNEALWIGADNLAGGNATDELMDGRIDDVRIFNYSLTPLQIKTIYNDGTVRFD